jgi:glucokinase
MTIERNGPPCRCGNLGCLEAIAAGTAIGRRFARALGEGRRSIASNWLGERTPTAEDVVRAAQQGDPLGLEVFLDAADAIGVGVVNAVNIFNPEVVILGGGVTAAGDLLFDAVRRVVNERALPLQRRTVRIVPAALGDDAGLFGAALVPMSPN